MNKNSFVFSRQSTRLSQQFFFSIIIHREKDPSIALLHLLSALHQILAIFVADPSATGPPGSETRRSFRANAANAIPGYLVALEAMTNQTRDVVKTTDDFRTLLGQIDKLV